MCIIMRDELQAPPMALPQKLELILATYLLLLTGITI